MSDASRRPWTARVRRDFGSNRARKVGAVHLLLAGVGNVGLGVAVLLAAATGRLLPAMLAVGPNVVSGPVLLARGGSLPLFALLVTGVGVFLAVLGAVQVVGSRRGFAGSRSRLAVRSAVVGLVSVPTLPLSAIAATLLALSGPGRADDG